jgi:hypothetical protein
MTVNAPSTQVGHLLLLQSVFSSRCFPVRVGADYRWSARRFGPRSPSGKTFIDVNFDAILTGREGQSTGHGDGAPEV